MLPSWQQRMKLHSCLQRLFQFERTKTIHNDSQRAWQCNDRLRCWGFWCSTIRKAWKSPFLSLYGCLFFSLHWIFQSSIFGFAVLIWCLDHKKLYFCCYYFLKIAYVSFAQPCPDTRRESVKIVLQMPKTSLFSADVHSAHVSISYLQMNLFPFMLYICQWRLMIYLCHWIWVAYWDKNRSQNEKLQLCFCSTKLFFFPFAY